MFRKLKNWLIEDGGSPAVEFALVGLPFIVMLIGIVETSMFFASGIVLEGATNDAARMIRTGQVQGSVNPLQTFQNELYTRVGMLIDTRNLQFEVLTVPNNSFSNVSAMTPQFDNHGNFVSGGFTPGGANDDILVRVVYRYVFLTPLLSNLMAQDVSGGDSYLMSTVVVQNEPYKYE